MQGDSKKGFEGLSNLETGIDDILKEEKKEKNISKKTSSHKKNNTNSKKEHHTDTSDLEKSPNEKSTESRLNTFFAFVILAIIFIIIINLATNDTNNTSSSKTNYTQAAKTEKYTYSKPKQFTCEEQQPSSYSTVLNIKEVCFCLAEKIRINAASKVIDRYSQTSINTYNQMVDNYNSKCNYKQYYKNDWQKANSYIQQHINQYKNEGRKKLLGNSSFTKYSLTIQTIPYNAKVQIMNIKPKYHDGILLKKGRYDIRVSKRGYKTFRQWITINQDSHYTITLQKDY